MGESELKQKIYTELKDKFSIETEIERGCYGSGSYLKISMKLDGEEISETSVALSELRECDD